MIFDKYSISIPGWVTAIEAVGEESVEGEELGVYQFDPLRISLIEDPAFVIAVLSLQDGNRPPWISGQIELRTATDVGGVPRNFENVAELNGLNDENSRFLDQQGTLIILHAPGRRHFEVSLTSTPQLPVAVNFMAFHGIRAHSTAIKCWTCKTAAKGLALAIVAAATLPALPAALIAAVAAWLGVTVVVAAAFIASVVGDTVDVIVEKLCKKVGLC